MEFADKNIVITGAERDFGRALAIFFASSGADVYLASINKEPVFETAELVEKISGRKAYAHVCNISQSSDVARFAQDLASRVDAVDLLINNAAAWLKAEFVQASDEDIANAINVTLTGTVLVTKHLMPLLLKSKQADIVNIISRTALEYQTESEAHEAYQAAKTGLVGFGDRLRQRLQKTGIRVISIFPPKFDNVSFGTKDWKTVRTPGRYKNISARSVLEAIEFTLKQDRMCTVEKIILANNRL